MLAFVMEPTNNRLLRIGEVAQLMGVVAQTLINYEQRGLVKPLLRSEAGHRLYGAEEVAQLQFIKQANLAGLTLAEVKELLSLIAEGERGENIPQVKEILEEGLRETERKMQEIAAFRDNLLYYRWRLEEIEDGRR
jgi:DNA-binding transcriptional MerR regulator